MDPTDTRLLAVLEKGLPLVAAPFDVIGREVGIPEREVIDRLRHLKESGIIRRFRARIDQRLLGITANALVAWNPYPADGGQTGMRLAAVPGVTHCYERRPVPGRWDYTWYTVHHGYNRDEVLAEIAAVAREVGCPDYRVLFSTREYKRVPNVRIRENGGGVR